MASIIKYNGKLYVHRGCSWHGSRQGDCIIVGAGGVELSIPFDTEVWLEKSANDLAMEYLEAHQ
jgi:hypothetical protein